MSQKEQEDNLLHNLKDVGLSSDQIFQLLMEKEKTLQKQEERKIKELESNGRQSTSTSQCTNSNQDNISRKRTLESSPAMLLNLIKKSKRNGKTLMDLCNDEILLIFEYLSNFDVFKMSQLSKGFRDLVEQVNVLHLVTKIRSSTLIHFMNSRYFYNIQKLIIDITIPHIIAQSVLTYCNSNRLKELKLTVDDNSEDTLSFSQFKESSFKNLEKLHIICGEKYVIQLDNIELFNLTDLTIDGACCPFQYYLNKHVNNITRLHLEKVEHCTLSELPLVELKHLTIRDSNLSITTIASLLNNSEYLEYVNLFNVYGFDSDEEDEEEEDDSIEVELPSLQTLIINNVCHTFTSLIFKSEMPDLNYFTIQKMLKSDAEILKDNASITSLKTLKVEEGIEEGAMSLLVQSSTFFNEIECIRMEFKSETIDPKSLVYISSKPNLFRNLTELVLHTIDGGSTMEGYQSFFTSKNISNIKKLSLVCPWDSQDLIFLANTTVLPELTRLTIFDTLYYEKFNDDFFSTFAKNSNFKNLEELRISFINDDGIREILDSRHLNKLKKIVVSEMVVTAWGFKQLENRGLEWTTFESIKEDSDSEEEEEEEDDENSEQ
ncbi:predicted protein [Naegleria gruberi]|uniref:Predicted protein n=1 Tax=Naegleria gruberi TaxID=5762 RepID=D2W3Y8_NAEGR|nr:uncharacterized protein NAEGRDRAFT_76114 [Naegleria gruberi]EFC36201.1 predicted protein [Naegleria gruberi]|eukprot:XP_002668945.1 predicted protein [Naegleria gruberi strain NEG-M]